MFNHVAYISCLIFWSITPSFIFKAEQRTSIYPLEPPATGYWSRLQSVTVARVAGLLMQPSPVVSLAAAWPFVSTALVALFLFSLAATLLATC